MSFTTYKDLVDHVLDYLGADVSKEGRRLARRAIQAAYQDVAKCHRWTYLLLRGRINTVASYDTGTIAYDHTGGTYERELTLSSGTWPSWAADGVVVIDDIAYEVDERKSDTVLTLESTSNPGADVAAATEYTIYQDTYALPSDFQEAGEFICVDGSYYLGYVSPTDWIKMHQSRMGPGTPFHYTFTGDPNNPGGMAARFYPPPDAAHEIDFLYKRFARPLVYEEVKAGTVDATANSATITGSGTGFASAHVGSVIRFSDGSQNVPTGIAGGYPFSVERVITAVASATSLTVDSAMPENLSGVKYSISDPVDIDSGAMLTFLLRCCEKQARLVTRSKHTPEEVKELRDAEFVARETDARSFNKRAAGAQFRWPTRLANFPVDWSE